MTSIRRLCLPNVDIRPQTAFGTSAVEMETNKRKVSPFPEAVPENVKKFRNGENCATCLTVIIFPPHFYNKVHLQRFICTVTFSKWHKLTVLGPSKT